MASDEQRTILELHPAEMAQSATGLIPAVAWHACGIEVGGAGPVAHKTAALPLAPAQLVMHMTAHHQGQGPVAADGADRQGQVLVAPVAGWLFPVAAAEIRHLAAQTGRGAVGQQQQGQGRVGLCSGSTDAGCRLIKAEGAIHRLNGLGEMEATAGAAGPGSHHRQPGGVQLAQTPAAVQRAQQIELALQGAATAIPARVVVAEDAGQGQVQGRKALGDAGLAVAQIPHHQQGIGLEQPQHLLIAGVPLAVQITGDGETQRRPGGWTQTDA